MTRDEFMAMVAPDPESGCWMWTGPGQDYGIAYEDDGTMIGAHRVSYRLHKGPLIPGLVIDHLCGVHGCVNPDHLEQVTLAENTRRWAPKKSRKGTALHPGPVHDVAVFVPLDKAERTTLRAAAARLGLGLGPWLRALGLAAVQETTEPLKPGVNVALRDPARRPPAK